MTPPRAMHSVGTQSLLWLLLLALALMGLTVTRQQALGSLHRHDQATVQGPSTLASVTASLASDWLNRWRQQQRWGHGALPLHMATDVPHTHGDLERHHHAAGDPSVESIDGAADAADNATTTGMVLLTAVATPSRALVVLAVAAERGPWPVDRFATFKSRSVAPLLRPPAC